MLTNLSSSVQGENQEVQEYVDQVARLRNDIITISKEEGVPIEPQMVRDRYFHALTVGITKDAVRLEIQSIIKTDPNISDVELGAHIQRIESREKEHEKKMEEARRKAAQAKGAMVNKLSTGERTAGEQAIFDELGKIAARVDEISTTKSDEIAALKQQMFLLQNRQDELGAFTGGGGCVPGWQAQDGTTYYSNNNTFGGFNGFANQGRGKRGGMNRDGYRKQQNQQNNSNNKQQHNVQNYQQNNSNQTTHFQNQNQNPGQQSSWVNRGGFNNGSSRGGRGGNMAVE